MMTAGAAHDRCQAPGRLSSLHARPKKAKAFYLCITGFAALAAGLNLLGSNSNSALVWSGIEQGLLDAAAASDPADGQQEGHLRSLVRGAVLGLTAWPFLAPVIKRLLNREGERLGSSWAAP